MEQPLTPQQIELITLQVAIGPQVAQLLFLKFDKKMGRTKTTYGTKSIQGLGTSIMRIVEEETSRLILSSIDKKYLL
jgi:hypothetical protein